MEVSDRWFHKKIEGRSLEIIKDIKNKSETLSRALYKWHQVSVVLLSSLVERLTAIINIPAVRCVA